MHAHAERGRGKIISLFFPCACVFWKNTVWFTRRVLDLEGPWYMVEITSVDMCLLVVLYVIMYIFM